MRTEIFNNPFSITKATEFTDTQIDEFWVALGDNKLHLNPTEPVPKYILGGKGCGKTHLLRYNSFPLQKIRHQSSLRAIIETDRYIGIYSVLDGINSSRFKGKGIDDDKWASVFEYYFELYIIDKLLSVLNDFCTEKIISQNDEKALVKYVLGLFYKPINEGKSVNIEDLIIAISDLRKKIDVEIVNAAFTRKIEPSLVTILFSPGDLLFGIPGWIAENLSVFKDVQFIYILDEYEKLFEWQKVFINTLVWEKKTPCTFWIGARRYGYTNMGTKMGEQLKPGSEYQPIFLDETFQNNEKLYEKFAKDLYIGRLKKANKHSISEEEIEKHFTAKFEKYSEELILKTITDRNNGKEYKHIKDLRKRINEAIRIELIENISDLEIEELIKLLLSETHNNPLEQKYKIYLFYREWANNKDRRSIGSIIRDVNLEYIKYLNGKESEFNNIKEKYKEDLIAQLTSDYKIKNTCYTGIDDFISLSWGNPRVFLIILKLVIEKSDLFGESPLDESTKISAESQYHGVYETAKWFYQDAEIIGDEGKNLYKSLSNLTDIFQIYRFSDKPTETSVCAFNFGMEKISKTALDYIELAKLHSILIQVPSRKQRSSGRKETTYQLNRILSPLWNLPIARRGIVDFDKKMIEVIFNPDEFDDFRRTYRDFRNKFMAPAFGKRVRKEKKVDKDTLESQGSLF